MSIGPLQIIVVLVIVLLLFGKRLPSVLGDVGKGLRNLKKGLRGEDTAAGDERVALQEKSQRGELTDAEREKLDKLESDSKKS